VQALLRERGSGRVDALVISHADSDHYNGGIDLVSQTPVGTALFSQHCLDFEQEGVPELFEELVHRGTSLRMIQAGDRLLLDPEVTVEVLHPTPSVDDAHDNANSVVLRITYAGKTLLLTGDLERQGSTQLQQDPLEPIDLLLAPHHGGKSANTAAFAQWTRPRHVVASCGSDITLALAKIYDRAETIHCTATSGAVRVHVTPDGVLDIQTYNDLRAR
jgi:competence protein ComEC